MKKHVLIFLFVYAFSAFGNVECVLDIGIDTRMHLKLHENKLEYCGNSLDVSTHRDLRRWSAYYSEQPTAYITLNKSEKIAWKMDELYVLPSSSDELVIKSVSLLASGRQEISMHPFNIDEVKLAMDDNKRANFIAWDQHNLMICDNGNGASPYSVKVTFGPKSATIPKVPSWVSRNHKMIIPERSSDVIALDNLLFSDECDAFFFDRKKLKEIPIDKYDILFNFQDEEQLYAQYFGKSRDRLVDDHFSLLDIPPLEIATCYTSDGKLRSMRFIFYSTDESVLLDGKSFIKLVNKILHGITKQFGKNNSHQYFYFPGGNNGETAHWDVWKWQCKNKIIELNSGIEMQGKNIKLARYVHVNVIPINNGYKPLVASSASLAKNIQKNGKGDCIIKNIPMVNQGSKGYCVVAILSAALLYMGIDTDQYCLNLYTINFTPIDHFMRYAGFPLKYYREDMPSPPRDMIVKEYNLQKDGKHLSIDEDILYGKFGEYKEQIDLDLLDKICVSNAAFPIFVDNIVKYIDKGIPICWGISGHVRMITGYNASTREIIYRDSWGKSHETKRMGIIEAFCTTNEFLIFAPTR